MRKISVVAASPGIGPSGIASASRIAASRPGSAIDSSLQSSGGGSPLVPSLVGEEVGVSVVSPVGAVV
ncbi:hypothetical protein [Nannocystis punicea]|uniref:Uncharacterized protein n=1 Tax=Nannocystis punicea TaxID=2995304 RepID=A0ABY7GWV2_9BACT|nr:hypothetical protein [Nannocystis poenicansa]WAS91468.1 hypothetical protein O0S08_35240 [Nannocystis poenicansa]